MIRDEGRGVGDGLGVQDARGARREGRGHGVGIRRVDERDLHPEPTELVEEQGAGRAVDRLRDDDPITGSQLRCEGGVDGAHAGREGRAQLAARQLRIRRAEGRRGGVAVTRVRVAGALSLRTSPSSLASAEANVAVW